MPDQEKPNDRYGTAPEDAYKEASSKNRRERRLRMLEVIGLWLAAGVGLLAVIVASLDARGQARCYARSVERNAGRAKAMVEG